jgi:acetyl esterase/lipase
MALVNRAIGCRAGLALAWLWMGIAPVVGQNAPAPASDTSLPRLEKDLAYGPAGDEQKLDLYLPKQKGFTTLVFTFGGGWHTGNRKAVAPIGRKLQDLGFGCALLSHRLGPKDKFPAQIEDVASGFAWVKKHMAEKGGDPKRVFLLGHSSGAHLSVLLAADARYLAKHQLKPSDIAGVIGLSTPVDLEPRRDGRGFGNTLMAGRGADTFSRDVGVLRDASPLQYVSKDLPPVLLVVGERDFPMLAGDAKSFVAKAQVVGVPAAWYLAKGRDHMGVIRALLGDHDPIEDQILAFVKRPGARAAADDVKQRKPE